MVPLPAGRSGKHRGKPRHSGLTMIVDAGMPLGQQADLLALAADYVDLAKIKTGTARLACSPFSAASSTNTCSRPRAEGEGNREQPAAAPRAGRGLLCRRRGIEALGPDVNLANVSPGDLIDLETTRVGLGVAGPPKNQRNSVR
jgi:hypothetical protein